MKRWTFALATLASAIAAVPAFAHHAEDEGIVEALLDHMADHWMVTSAAALVFAIVVARLWIARTRAGSPGRPE